MGRPEQYFDWQDIVDEQLDEPIASTRDRLRWILALFGLAAAMILGRAVAWELSDGAEARRRAAAPLERSVALPARRGRILARDGMVLAVDAPARGLAIQFPYLQSPPDPQWLRRTARARLPRGERRNRQRLEAAEQTLRAELAELHRRLARLCEISPADWQARGQRVQTRVAALSAAVNQRRLERFERQLASEATESDSILSTIWVGLFAPPEPLPPPPIVIAEQVGYHRLVDALSPAIAAEIAAHPAVYPGVKIVEYTRRDYPQGASAAQLVGYVGPASRDVPLTPPAGRAGAIEPAGVSGIELRCDATLRGQAGCERHFTDHRGKLLEARLEREPTQGHDIILSLDPRLQQASEELLDRATRRLNQAARESTLTQHGGAIVVLDVRSGEVLTAASAPRFEPAWFATADPRVASVLGDPRQPLFDRALKMALPPGSVFKPVTALALLQESVVDPRQPFRCQGFWREPEGLRCQIFRNHGIGHGDITLPDALAQSCNVYFFHHATQLGAARLVDWAARLGVGQATGIDGCDESAGQLPQVIQLRASGQTQLLAIGQGPLTMTPLQVARLYAAIANGGHLIAPRLAREQVEVGGVWRASTSVEPGEIARIAEIRPQALEVLRDGLRRVVEDPNGTAYASVRLPHLAIAGKTGSAETGGDQADHAWFAGYVPAEAPRYALVVVLEHAGSGASAAGTLARHLVLHMQQLGYFGPPPPAEIPTSVADQSIPPGKG